MIKKDEMDLEFYGYKKISNSDSWINKDGWKMTGTAMHKKLRDDNRLAELYEPVDDPLGVDKLFTAHDDAFWLMQLTIIVIASVIFFSMVF